MSRRQVRGAVDSAGPQELQSEHFGIVNPALEGQRRCLGDLEPDRFPVLLWIIEVRSLTRPAAKTSRTLRPTRSQPRNLLSTAMLNSARSRALPAISRRTRMDQTCRGSSGRFWPMMRPLFQGARTGRRTGRKSTDMGLPPVRRADPSSVMPTTTGYHVSGREGERRADCRLSLRVQKTHCLKHESGNYGLSVSVSVSALPCCTKHDVTYPRFQGHS